MFLTQTDTFAAPKTTTQPIPQPATKSVENDDIMKTLLAHEKTATTSHVPMGVTVAPPSDEDSSTSESDDETMVTNKPAVTVIGQSKSYIHLKDLPQFNFFTCLILDSFLEIINLSSIPMIPHIMLARLYKFVV